MLTRVSCVAGPTIIAAAMVLIAGGTAAAQGSASGPLAQQLANPLDAWPVQMGATCRVLDALDYCPAFGLSVFSTCPLLRIQRGAVALLGIRRHSGVDDSSHRWSKQSAF